MKCACGQPATHELAIRYRKNVMGRIATFGNGDADIPIGPAYCEVCVDKDVAAGVTQDDASWAATLAHFEKAKKDPPDRDLTILVKKPAGFHAAIHHG